MVRFLAHRECLISTLINHIELISKIVTSVYCQWIFQLWKIIRFSCFCYLSFYCFPFLPILCISILMFFFFILWFFSWLVVSERVVLKILASLLPLGVWWTYQHSEQVSLLVVSYRKRGGGGERQAFRWGQVLCLLKELVSRNWLLQWDICLICLLSLTLAATDIREEAGMANVALAMISTLEVEIENLKLF